MEVKGVGCTPPAPPVLVGGLLAVGVGRCVRAQKPLNFEGSNVGAPGSGVGRGVGVNVGSLLQKQPWPQMSPKLNLQRLGTAGQLLLQGILKWPVISTPGGRPGLAGSPKIGLSGP